MTGRGCGSSNMKYCVGYVSCDEVHRVGDKLDRCPLCGNPRLLGQAEYEALASRVLAEVEAQKPKASEGGSP